MTPTVVGQALNFDDLVLSQPAVEHQTSHGAAHCSGAGRSHGSGRAGQGGMLDAVADRARRNCPTPPASWEDVAERGVSCGSPESLGLQECVSQFRAGRLTQPTPAAFAAGRGELSDGMSLEASAEHAETGSGGTQACVDGEADGVWREEEMGKGFTQLNMALDISNVIAEEEEEDVVEVRDAGGGGEEAVGSAQLNEALDVIDAQSALDR